MFKIFKKKFSEENKEENVVFDADNSVDSWIASADDMKKKNQEVWYSLTKEEIKSVISAKAAAGYYKVTFFERMITDNDIEDLKKLGYKVKIGNISDGPYVEISWV